MTEQYPTESEMRSALVRRATEYCSLSGVAIYSLGKTLGRGKSFFKEIEDGRNFTVKTYTEVMAWFDEHWPEQTKDKSAEGARVNAL